MKAILKSTFSYEEGIRIRKGYMIMIKSKRLSRVRKYVNWVLSIQPSSFTEEWYVCIAQDVAEKMLDEEIAKGKIHEFDGGISYKENIIFSRYSKKISLHCNYKDGKPIYFLDFKSYNKQELIEAIEELAEKIA